MNIFKAKLEPDQIFDPRGEYNPDMYIPRPKYEDDLDYAFNSNMCILVHGQSGTGKTWLTRRVMDNKGIFYKVINLATASCSRSIYSCFQQIMARENWKIRTNYTEKKSASIGIPGTAQGLLEANVSYNISIDYYLEFLKFMSYRAKDKDKDKKRYIVFENFEAILDDKQLIKELTNLITLVDDDEVIKYKTKFIIIGATKDIHQFFKDTPNINTIENRIFELPEVSTLTLQQSHELINRGFKKLKINFRNDDLKTECLQNFTRVTGGIPQRVQELCLMFAQICYKNHNDIVNTEWIDESISRWIKTSLNKNYVFVSRLLKYESRSESFRNQVLYCLAQKDKLFFTSSEIFN